MKKTRGSAIIIAMFLIASVGAIAFGVAKAMFLETTITNAYENGAIAYYAAESGIEEAFLRYRYNQNAEIPSEGWALDLPNIYRSNLTLKTVSTNNDLGVDSATNIEPNNISDQIFDLRIGYVGSEITDSTQLSPIFGNNADQNNNFGIDDLKNANYDTGKNSIYKIPYDESVKIKLNNLDDASEDLTLFIKYYGVESNESTKKCKTLMEVKFVVETNGIQKEYKSLISYDPAACAIELNINEDKLMGVEGESSYNAQPPSDKTFYVTKTRLQKVITDNSGVIPSGSKVTLYLKPIHTGLAGLTDANKFASIGLAMNSCKNFNCNSKILPGPFTKIFSSGYYGGVERKIFANIDRQSGTVYDLFDYVIYNSQ